MPENFHMVWGQTKLNALLRVQEFFYRTNDQTKAVLIGTKYNFLFRQCKLCALHFFFMAQKYKTVASVCHLILLATFGDFLANLGRFSTYWFKL